MIKQLLQQRFFRLLSEYPEKLKQRIEEQSLSNRQHNFLF